MGLEDNAQWHEANHQDVARNQVKHLQSLPTSGNLYDVVFHELRGLEYYYNGTKWVTVGVNEAPIVPRSFGNPGTAPGAGNFLRLTMATLTDYDLWIEDMVLFVNHLTNQSNVNFYTVTCDFTGMTSFDTKAATTGGFVRYHPTVTPGAYVQSTNSGQMAVSFQQSGAPGNLEIVGKVRYRLIG